MLAVILLILGSFVDLLFLIGSLEQVVYRYSLGLSIWSLGLLWPSLLWFVFFIASTEVLQYWWKHAGVHIKEMKYILISVGLAIAPHILGYVISFFFQYQLYQALGM